MIARYAIVMVILLASHLALGGNLNPDAAWRFVVGKLRVVSMVRAAPAESTATFLVTHSRHLSLSINETGTEKRGAT
jgi:hypothetical protein